MDLEDKSVCHSFIATERRKGTWPSLKCRDDKDSQLFERLRAALGKRVTKVSVRKKV